MFHIKRWVLRRRKNRTVCKKKKPWIDVECEEKYKTIKSLSRTLQENPWDKHLRIKVYKLKKDFNKLTRKKHRLYRNILINRIVESEKNDPNEFWKTIDKLKNRSSDPSSGISSHEWLTYFRDLMNVDYTISFEVLRNVSLGDYDSNILNSEIRAEEVYKAVKTLKNQKACGTDGINNEMLKLACSMNVDIFVKVFNMILKSEVYHELWRENYIKPIFKGACLNNPSNYRGLALSSCFGKFFSKILHNRLHSFIENNNILHKGQIGFHKGCRTSDHIFTLKTLIDKAFRSTKRLYACFVDQKKAFDTVNRGALIYKLSCLGIKANFLNIMKNMYREVNYYVKLEEGTTDKFSSKVGVKQGYILSPTLFSLYINDLIQSLDIEVCD
jgi:hypothetical protein